MLYNAETKSILVTLVLVVVVAVITAFVAAWTQRLVMGTTYVGVTMGLSVAAALLVVSSRHLQRAK